MKKCLILTFLLVTSYIQSQTYSLDTSFATNGILRNTYALVPKEGFFVNNQYYFFGTDCRFTRFNFNGTLDYSFGNSGFRIMDVLNNTIKLTSMKMNNGAIYSYGKLSPYTTPELPNGVIFKLLLNGQPDPTFGQNGMAVLNLGMTEEIVDVAFNDDGSLFAIAKKTDPSLLTSQLVVAKFLPNGTLDTQFNSVGYKVFDYPTNLYAVGIYPYEGQFLIAGQRLTYTTSSYSDIVLMKMDANGNLSAGFGNNGELLIPIQESYSTSIVKMQFINNKFYCHIIWGYSFNLRGSELHVYDISAPTVLVGSCGVSDDAYIKVLDSDKIMITNGRPPVTTSSFAYFFNLYRKNPDCTPDTTFNEWGGYSYDFSNLTNGEGATFCYPHEDGRILIAGWVQGNNPFTLMRVTNSGLATEDTDLKNVFSVYPNPASNELHLSGTQNLAIEKVSICDISGKTITVDTFNGHSIDISGLQKGIYFLKILSEGKSYNLKFIKS